MTLRGDKIAILGDLHGAWNQLDSEYFDESGHDLLLFVGDLGSGTLSNELQVLKRLAALNVAGLVLPGNNDAEFLPELAAELAHQAGRADVLRIMGRGGVTSVEPCGYSSHLLVTDSGEVTLIAARPCAMGGSVFSFGTEIERTHGVTGMRDSFHRLKRLVDESTTDALVFMAHNGPSGLGGSDSDPWHRDFPLHGDEAHTAPLDWGDKDLQEAIAYAQQVGKTVLAVIAGHMHRATSMDKRRFLVEKDGVLYVNPAVVPRIRATADGELHHYVELVLRPGARVGAERVSVREVWQQLPGS